jgi:hypothetical protein
MPAAAPTWHVQQPAWCLRCLECAWKQFSVQLGGLFALAGEVLTCSQFVTLMSPAFLRLVHRRGGNPWHNLYSEFAGSHASTGQLQRLPSINPHQRASTCMYSICSSSSSSSSTEVTDLSEHRVKPDQLSPPASMQCGAHQAAPRCKINNCHSFSVHGMHKCAL